MDASAARIMVIEDDHDLMRLITHTLTTAGFHVIQAYGGQDGLRKVRLNRPDLILTDLAMPQMSGVEVIQRVKADPDTRHVPCVAVTAFMWDSIAQCAGQAGCDGYLPKPFTAARLLQEVAKYVALPGKLPTRDGASSRA